MLMYRFPLNGFIVLALLVLTACIMQPGSYSKSTTNGVERMYRYEEGGKKTLVYEVDPAGKVTVFDANDKQAKQRLAQEKRDQHVEQANATRMEQIKRAPKRKQSDPIFVTFQPLVDDGVGLSDKQKKDMFDYFKKQFENDPIIRLSARDNAKARSGDIRQIMSALKGGSSQKAPVSDVDLVIKVSTKTVYGLIKGKPAEGKAMVFKATVIGNWLPATFKAEESGTFFKLPEATQKLGDKLKKIIKEDIGPTIPADRSL